MSASPATGGVAVTPHDTNLIPGGKARSLYIGTGGTVTVGFTPSDLTGVLFTAVPGGFVLPVECYRVMATGTTATNIVALR